VAGRWRIGVDIGGTFTDVVLAEDETGRVALLKVPSDPQQPAAAVRRAVAAVLEETGVAPVDVTVFIHGTTMALNTVIERSGARVGFLVTRGYRDILELGRLRLRDPQNFYAERAAPLVPRRLVREIDERMLADGSVYRPLDEAQVAEAARELSAQGCSAIAVSFLHAYANGAHERIARRVVEAEAAAGTYVSTSHEVWPQRREYERSLVTVINAHVGQRMSEYFGALERELQAIGITAPLLSTKSNGGTMSARSAAQNPVETLFSGPASGVIGASYLAQLIGEHRVITLDMGGTSADVSVYADRYQYSTEATAGDFPILLPAIDISSIGAGGGSIAWTDVMGVLKVGPRSAGAVPGPACYGLGGTEPAVTDAYVTLGYVDPAHFLGGTMNIRRELAIAAVERLGQTLGASPEQTAWSILEVATANMYAQFTPLMARYGVDPRDYAIMAFGGAGPTHVFLLAREVGIRRVIVPALPGGMCALGCLVADLRADFVRTWGKEANEAGGVDFRTTLEELERRAQTWIESERVPVDSVRYESTAEMRYKGQSFEISVPIKGVNTLPEVLARFHDRYRAVYGYADVHAPVEVVDLRVQVVGETPKPRVRAAAPQAGAARRADRKVFFEGRHIDVGVYDRTRLAPGDAFPGPGIIEQYDTTTFVPPGFNVRVDLNGNLVGEAE
jgi:N-methylhydantoinase A